jgi:hypothetical protein
MAANPEVVEHVIAISTDTDPPSRAKVLRAIKGQPESDRPEIARKMAAQGYSTSQIGAHLGYGRGVVDFLKRHDIDVPADSVLKKTHNINSTRIVTSTIDAVNGIGVLFDQIDYTTLPNADVKGWLEVLNESIRSLTTLRNRLKETSQP